MFESACVSAPELGESAKSSALLRGVGLQRRACVLDGQYTPLCGDESLALERPDLADYYKRKRDRKSLLPMDYAAVMAMAAYQGLGAGREESDDDTEDEE